MHGIAYEPVAEHETFHAYALRDGDGAFAAFDELETYASSLAIPVVPVLFRGCFESVDEIRAFVEHAHSEPSVLGGQRERVVLRLARGVPAAQLQDGRRGCSIEGRTPYNVFTAGIPRKRTRKPSVGQEVKKGA